MQSKLGTPRLAPAAGASPGRKARFGFRLMQAPAVVALAAVLAVASPQQPADTLCNVPPTLSGEDKQQEKIKHPKSAKALQCTSKCVSTCILGGAGSPGIDGPFNVRRPLVVFKEDFRSRQYWYVRAKPCIAISTIPAC